MAGRYRELQLICSIEQTQKKTRRIAFQIGARIEIASFSEWLANMLILAVTRYHQGGPNSQILSGYVGHSIAFVD